MCFTTAHIRAEIFFRSVKGGEIYAFADAFNICYTIKGDLENIPEKEIRLQMLTDS